MSKKILLADDSITIQKVIELTFSDEDFEVVTVGNGRLAIERVQDVRPDLVLCDIIMPEKDGYEVCDFIKKNPALSRTPVLLLTGAFEPFDQERATRVGCDGFLAKPFEPQTLIAKVKDLLGRAGAAPVAGAATTAAAAPATPAPQPAPAWTKHPAPVATSPAPQPEPFAFVPEPPPTHEPPRPAAAAMPFEEAGVSFFTDETFEEIEQKPAAAPGARSGDTAPVPTFPETPDFAEYRGSAFDEVAPAAPTIALTAPPPPTPAPAPAPVAAARPAAGSGAFPALDEEEGPQTLLHVSSEEMATLRGEPSRPAAAPPPPPPAPAPAPVPARAPLWTQQTMEVPLETRARVAREASQAESEPIFEEVFEPAPAPPKPSPPPPPAVSAASRPPAPAAVPAPPKEPAVAPKPAPVPRPETSAPPSRPMPAPAPAPTAAPTPAPVPMPVPPPMAAPAPSMPAPVAAAVTPAVAATNAPSTRASQPDPETVAVRGAGDGGAVRSSVPSAAPAPADAAAATAAGVSVPVDMVSQIAQRVVAQISEKVIREVAWEVIPDLAEVLIKKEIERLKAELQQT